MDFQLATLSDQSWLLWRAIVMVYLNSMRKQVLDASIGSFWCFLRYGMLSLLKSR